jgi:hypothetical protein
MNVETAIPRPETRPDAVTDFSLVLGGPLYQFLRRVGLVKPPLDRVGGRIVVLTLFAWAPLLVFATLGGRLWTGVNIPFVRDFEVHARLLLALPLLIAAEVTVHRRTQVLLAQFLDRQIIGPSIRAQFDACIESAMRLRNSPVIELGILVFVLAVGSVFTSTVLPIQSDTWYATLVDGRKVLAPAGYWYQHVSLPLYQFILLRWLFRLFIWTRLLWQISRMDLTLVASHPDGRCGLGFLGTIATALGPFLMAQTVLLAGYLANRILHEGAKLPDYAPEIVAEVLFLFVVALGPISVFTPKLIQQRLRGLRAYGALASEYVIGFERKWMTGERPDGEALVGSSDIQSLADLANSFAVVQHVSPLPFGRETIIGLAVIVVLPLLPLVLTMFSMRELVVRLLQVLL